MESYESTLRQYGKLLWTATGTSMLPMIHPKTDLLLIEGKTAQCRPYDVVLYRREADGQYILHRILKDNGDGSYFIMGDNCTSGETVRDECVIGVLKGLQRGSKKVRLDSLRMKLYVHLWCAPYRFRILLRRVLHHLSGSAV